MHGSQRKHKKAKMPGYRGNLGRETQWGGFKSTGEQGTGESYKQSTNGEKRNRDRN